MGERVAYRVREGDEVSPLLRKQWYCGGTPEELEAWITEVGETLLQKYDFDSPGPNKMVVGEAGDGGIALRDDLEIGRLQAAMFAALYRAPFDSIETDVNCDITDHGIFEIELERWDTWVVNHYPVPWDRDKPSEEGAKNTLGKVTWTEGSDKPTFEWFEKFDL